MKRIAAFVLVVCLLLAGCSFGTQKLAVSDAEYANYVGAWFRGEDPWGGTVTVMIKSIVNGKMDWTFTEAFEEATLYQELKGTEVQSGTTRFTLKGSAAEDKNAAFEYQGLLELKDGTVVMTFAKWAVSRKVSGETVTIQDTSESKSLTVTLTKPPASELNTYTVQSGDSLHSIAEKYGISTRDLAIMNQTVIIETAKANGYEFDDVIEYAKYLFPGEVLVVPSE